MCSFLRKTKAQKRSGTGLVSLMTCEETCVVYCRFSRLRYACNPRVLELVNVLFDTIYDTLTVALFSKLKYIFLYVLW